MHGFFPGALLVFGPIILLIGLLKIAIVVFLIVLLVRIVSHGGRHGHYMHGMNGMHGYGRGYGHGFDSQNTDPRRVAALRYAAGEIDHAEFDRIIAGLDASSPADTTTPPSAPTPPSA